MTTQHTDGAPTPRRGDSSERGTATAASAPPAAGSSAGSAAGSGAPAVDVHGLNTVEMGAWRGFLNAHAHVIRRLEAELEHEQGMPLANYDVLVQLAEAPGHALRMSELASSVLLSRSGLTRLVDRLERENLVQRQACPDDARGTLAVLTPAGMSRLREAWVTHLRGVREHMVSRFSQEELATLGDLLARLA